MENSHEKDGFLYIAINEVEPDFTFFYDKTRDLLGKRIKCLFTFHDRTKIKKVRRNGIEYFEGKDYNAIATIVTHLNGKLHIETLDNALINPWFEAINWPDKTNRKIKILTKRDISILIKSEQFTVDDQIVENLYPHTQNDLNILVPKAPEIPVGELMLAIYKPCTWVLNLSMSLIIFLLIATIRKLYKKSIIIEDILFEVWSVLVINQVFHFSRNSLERLLIFDWILCGFLINMFVQTKITSFLAIRNNYPDINTIEQLFESGLPLYSLPNYAEEVQKKYTGTQYEKFTQRLLPLASDEGSMDQMTYRTNVSQIPAFLIEHDIALFVSRCKNLRINGAQMYHLVKESIIPNYQAYKVVHNSPLLPILNKKLRRLGEGGFIGLWAKRSIHNATLEGFLSPEAFPDTDAVKPLTLNMTLFFFYGLLLGLLFATFAFLVEIFVYEITKPKKITFLR
ncbi:uncharacterized protein LOC123010591 [Tribolium madens]|uniref:uncharacterized protein LOC123010591 n=1 Tax=Tribolium madens TaxID=41895 RepID=UPI001CF73467|nr:uncharacterized protein LOC123010591 [Tribolium madens]